MTILPSSVAPHSSRFSNFPSQRPYQSSPHFASSPSRPSFSPPSSSPSSSFPPYRPPSHSPSRPSSTSPPYFNRRPFPRPAANLHQTLSSDVEQHDSYSSPPLHSLNSHPFADSHLPSNISDSQLPDSTHISSPVPDPLAWFSAPDDPSPYCYDSYYHDFLMPTDTFSHDHYMPPSSSSFPEFYSFIDPSLSMTSFEHDDNNSHFL